MKAKWKEIWNDLPSVQRLVIGLLGILVISWLGTFYGMKQAQHKAENYVTEWMANGVETVVGANVMNSPFYQGDYRVNVIEHWTTAHEESNKKKYLHIRLEVDNESEDSIGLDLHRHYALFDIDGIYYNFIESQSFSSQTQYYPGTRTEVEVVYEVPTTFNSGRLRVAIDTHQVQEYVALFGIQ